MAKRNKPNVKKNKPNGKDHTDEQASAPVTHRLTIHKPNGPSESMEVAPGPIPIGEAMRLAVQELGEVQIDDDLAPAHLRELAETYEQYVREVAAFNAKSDAAKVAKKSVDSITDLLLQKIKQFTHPSPLPLFDQAEREADLSAMRGGGDVEELGSFNGAAH